ncbi:MAG: SCO6880 family protein [Actinomycetota bacterium]
MSDARRHVRFGSSEAGGSIGGLRWSQVAITGAGAAAMLLCLRAGGPAAAAAGLALGAAALAVAFVPVAGRPLEAWAMTAVGWAVRRGSGAHRFEATAPVAGRRGGGEALLDLPPCLDGVRIDAIRTPAGLVGAVREGAWLTAVLDVEGTSFALLDPEDKDRRVAAFGHALSSFARPGSPVRRIQWIERSAPQPVGELARHLRDQVALPVDHRSVRSYLDLVDGAGPDSQDHSCLVALQVDPRRGGRGAAREGRGALLMRELNALSDRLLAAEIGVRGALTPRALARTLREGLDPDGRWALDGPGGDGDGADPGRFGPLALEEGWGVCRTDSAWHASYWISEWPRTDVGCDFLLPLLLGTGAERAISVVMEPLDPSRALRAAENARTNQEADEELRLRAGFMETARRRRRREAAHRREQELADGHAAFRFSGYVTVSARGLAELDASCAAVEQAARLAHLELRRLYGEQQAALTYTLPLCRGLR